MCDNAQNHSHAHGVRSDAEKALADLRENLTESLKAITKYESQQAVMSTADFPDAGEVVHVLGHLMEDQKRHAAELMRIIVRIDPVQRKMMEKGLSAHAHGHEGSHDHGHGEA